MIKKHSVSKYLCSVDVAIVGGGAIGMAIAWEFVRRNKGFTLAIISPCSDKNSASYSSGAMLSGYGETTEYSFASEAGRLKMQLRIEAAKHWKSWSAELAEMVDDRDLVVKYGTSIITNTVSSNMDERNFEAIVNWLQNNNEPFEKIDAIKDLGLQADMADRPTKAIYIASEGYVNSVRVLGALESLLQNSDKVNWIDAPCLEVSAVNDTGGGYVAKTASGDVFAKQVIISAGVNSHQIIRNNPFLANKIPPIFSGTGTSIRCTTLSEGESAFKSTVRTPNRAFSCGLHVLATTPNEVYIGATNNIQEMPSRTAILSDVSFLIDCAVHQVDRRLSAYSIKEISTGNRPITADTFPLFGETSLPGYWVITGTYRDGFLMAPLIAKKLFDALTAGKKCLDGVEIFQPERVPLSSGTRERIFQESVNNFIAIAFERRAKMPQVGDWYDDFVKEVENRVLRIYDCLESDFVPHPDLLWDLEKSGLMQPLKRYCKLLSE